MFNYLNLKWHSVEHFVHYASSKTPSCFIIWGFLVGFSYPETAAKLKQCYQFNQQVTLANDKILSWFQKYDQSSEPKI